MRTFTVEVQVHENGDEHNAVASREGDWDSPGYSTRSAIADALRHLADELEDQDPDDHELAEDDR